MKLHYQLPSWAAVFALVLVVSLPSAAGAESEGRGKKNREHSSQARGGQSGGREYSRGGVIRPSGERMRVPRAGQRAGAEWRRSDSRNQARWRETGSRRIAQRDQAQWRDSGSRRSGSRAPSAWRDQGSRGSRPRVDGHDRRQRSDHRADARWRDSGSHHGEPVYSTRTRYRHDGPSYSHHDARSYYFGSFHRPRYVHHSGFSLGVVISSVPSYGYRYRDPYCDIGFRDLDDYYDHCGDYSHPEAILVLDARYGSPIAFSAYRDGYWVVDDCY